VRPRILQVLFSYQIGGSEVFGFELARQLAAQGIEVLCTALLSSPGPMLAKCGQCGIETVDLKISATNPLTRNGLSLRLTRELRKLRLDAVHLQHFLSLNKLGMPATLAGIKRIVVTEHSLFDVSASFAGRLRTRINWRMTSAVTVVHSDIRDYLCGQLGLPAERVHVVPMGIDVAAYQRGDRAKVREQLGIEDGELVFVFLGRLAPVKNVTGLIAAFLAVTGRCEHPSRLIVVGEGEERAACEALIATHPQGSRVRLTGQQLDARPYLAAGDVFVMNSHSEGTPRALLEAMAMDLPAVCSAVGGIPDMLADGRGWLTLPGRQASLESALAEVLSNPVAIAAIGARCRDYVRTSAASRNERAKGCHQAHLVLGSTAQ
jgi:glycosyltransferase involved in cell wall biosynthesis